MRLFVVTLGFVFLTGAVNAGENVVLKDQRDKVSYGIGMDIGKNLKNQSIDMTLLSLRRG